MQRLVELKEPPAVGETYLVTVMKDQYGNEWPVMGVPHKDPELSNHFEHWHIDTRFVQEERLDDCFPNYFANLAVNCGFFAVDLDAACGAGVDTATEELPLTCLRDGLLQHRNCKTKGLLGEKYIDELGQRLRKEGYKLNPACKVCPHRGTRLDNIKPVDGVILCPAHGLAFDAETGAALD